MIDALAMCALAIGALALVLNAALGLAWALIDATLYRTNALSAYAREAGQSFVVLGMLAALLHAIGAL